VRRLERTSVEPMKIPAIQIQEGIHQSQREAMSEIPD
jgi:hypothetical protein